MSSSTVSSSYSSSASFERSLIPNNNSVEIGASDAVDDSLLAMNESGGDPMTEVAILLARSFREDHRQALQRSDVEELARLREGEAKVQEMREKANAIRAEGWARGAMLAVSGGLNIGGAFTATSKAGDRAMNGLSGMGKLAEGAGSIFGNAYSANAVLHQAESDRHEGRASAHQIASEKYREEANSAQKMVGKVMDFLSNLSQSRTAAEGAASKVSR
jgi:hypothetical protein